MRSYKSYKSTTPIIAGGFGYNKEKIKKTCLEYIASEDDEIFVQLLRDLEPMINGIVFRHYFFNRHGADIKQEILVCLWRYQRNPVLLRRQNKKFLSNYFFFIIRGYCREASEKMYRIYEKPHQAGGNWIYNEYWMGGSFEDMRIEMESE